MYVDSTERTDIPPYGHLVDYLTFGGLYRDVYLTCVNPVFIENIFVKTGNVMSNPVLACEIRVNQAAPNFSLEAVLIDPADNEVVKTAGNVEREITALNFDSLPDIRLWSLEDPVLYTLQVTLFHNGEKADTTSTRFGFREAAFRPDGGFYLNGERVKLIGLDRHQT